MTHASDSTTSAADASVAESTSTPSTGAASDQNGNRGCTLELPLEQMAVALMERARAEGVALVGPGGLLQGLAKTVLESALEAELSDHLGYEPYEPAGQHTTSPHPYPHAPNTPQHAQPPPPQGPQRPSPPNEPPTERSGLIPDAEEP